MSEAYNPLMRKNINFADIKAALNKIYSDIPGVIDAIDKHASTASGDSEMQVIMNMSSLEIQMTNVAKDFRESLI